MKEIVSRYFYNLMKLMLQLQQQQQQQKSVYINIDNIGIPENYIYLQMDKIMWKSNNFFIYNISVAATVAVAATADAAAATKEWWKNSLFFMMIIRL